MSFEGMEPDQAPALSDVLMNNLDSWSQEGKTRTSECNLTFKKKRERIKWEIDNIH